MPPSLVKVDVVSALLGWQVKKLYSLVNESSTKDRGFAWVFNLACDPQAGRQELRWWWPEIQARISPDGKEHGRYAFFQLEWVINRIVPANRPHFPAGEVDRLLQIRPQTRLSLHAEWFGPGETARCAVPGGPPLYPRTPLAEFLERRWIQNLKKPAVQPKNLTTTEIYAHAQ
ncbi:MAG TPA: hypothetical protein VK742_19185 [Candidatus Sulfotelmatobacter sp.]|jgi:hypothetical protein|nr:hypothetical protein [Candidatus Sulfotelmatobacter sp.]